METPAPVSTNRLPLCCIRKLWRRKSLRSSNGVDSGTNLFVDFVNVLINLDMNLLKLIYKIYIFVTSDSNMARNLLDDILAKDRGEISPTGERDWDADEIREHIFLGSEDAALAPKQELSNRGITHIIVCGFGLQSPYPEEFTYLKLKLVDLPIQPITAHLRECIEFIASAKSTGGKVLIHCARGVSRSAAVTTGCLMKLEGISFPDAYHLVRSKRACVGINSGFQEQLSSLDINTI